MHTLLLLVFFFSKNMSLVLNTPINICFYWWGFWLADSSLCFLCTGINLLRNVYINTHFLSMLFIYIFAFLCIYLPFSVFVFGLFLFPYINISIFVTLWVPSVTRYVFWWHPHLSSETTEIFSDDHADWIVYLQTV